MGTAAATSTPNPRRESHSIPRVAAGTMPKCALNGTVLSGSIAEVQSRSNLKSMGPGYEAILGSTAEAREAAVM